MSETRRWRLAMVCSALFLTSSLALGNASVAVDGYSPEPGPSPWGPGDEAGNTNTQTPEKALEAAKLIRKGMTENDIREGDVVLVRTGWEEHWDDGTTVYYAGAPGLPGSTPGLGLPAAQWLAAKRVACVGADNWGVEVAGVPRPPSDPSYVEGVSFPVHNELIVRNGIPLQESMHLSELADDAAAELGSGRAGRDAYTFAYVFVPVPVEGASGSPGIPMALK